MCRTISSPDYGNIRWFWVLQGLLPKLSVYAAFLFLIYEAFCSETACTNFYEDATGDFRLGPAIS